MSSRPLNTATVPLIGPIDIEQPIVVVAQQANAIYILCLFSYADGSYELMFSPYFSGIYDSPDGSGDIDNTSNLLLSFITKSNGLAAPSEVIVVPNTIASPITIVPGPKPNVPKPSTITMTNVAVLLYQPDGSFQVLDQDGNSIGFAKSIVGGAGDADFAYEYTTIGDEDDDDISTYSVVPQNSSLTYPNIYAGENYTLEYGGVVPFRFMSIYEGQDSMLLTPSYCGKTAAGDKTPPKEYTYQCNTYSTIAPYNLLRYIDGRKTSDTVIYANSYFFLKDSPQVAQTLINFFPTNYYPSNISFAADMIQPGPIICTEVADSITISNYDPSPFMKYSFYFWASGFSTYSNNGLTQNPIITQGAAGFIGKGPSKRVDATGWTNLADCTKSYFYTYCQPNTTASSCGSCLGDCPIGKFCDENLAYIDPPPQGQNPFYCGNIPKPPNQLKSFWDKYKTQIIIGIIVGVVILAFFLVFIFLFFKSRGGNQNNDHVQREIYN